MLFVALHSIHLKNLFNSMVKRTLFGPRLLEVTISTVVVDIILNYMPNCIEFQI